MRVDRSAGFLTALWMLISLSACFSTTQSEPTNPSTETIDVTTAIALEPSENTAPSITAAASPTERPTPGVDDWKTYPVVPAFESSAAEILQRGISMHRDLHAFSKIGDCQNITTYFLADFDRAEKYRLGPHADLQETIDWFAGSFSRKSLAVKGGLNVASVMNPLMSNPAECPASETPLACELRVHNPSLVLISFEEAWDGNVEKYDTYLRKVIEYVLAQGVVPVVATKADNLEGGDRINERIARLAWEYGIPLWNFWAGVQPLHSHGLTGDGFHLTQGKDFQNYFFDLRPADWSGWMVRNLSALQVLDAARKDIIAPTVG